MTEAASQGVVRVILSKRKPSPSDVELDISSHVNPSKRGLFEALAGGLSSHLQMQRQFVLTVINPSIFENVDRPLSFSEILWWIVSSTSKVERIEEDSSIQAPKTRDNTEQLQVIIVETENDNTLDVGQNECSHQQRRDRQQQGQRHGECGCQGSAGHGSNKRSLPHRLRDPSPSFQPSPVCSCRWRFTVCVEGQRHNRSCRSRPKERSLKGPECRPSPWPARNRQMY